MRANTSIALFLSAVAICLVYAPPGKGEPPGATAGQQLGTPRASSPDAGQPGASQWRPIFDADIPDHTYVWAAPYDCFGDHPAGAPPPAFAPQDRLFMFRAYSIMYDGDGRLICTIPWDGREVLLKYRDGAVFVRRTDREPWRLHHAGLGKATALAKLHPADRPGAPYSIGLALPIDREAVAVLKTLGVKEVVVWPHDQEEEKAVDEFDLSPLAELPLESLIIELGELGKPSIKGLDKMGSLQALAVTCWTNETFPLGLLRGAAGVRYLSVFGLFLDCDVDPRVFRKLSYCRFQVGKATGMRRFVEGVVAQRLHLGVQVGLTELAERTTLSPSVKHLRIEDSWDLKDLSRIKASPNLQELEIVGCRLLKDSDGFRKPAAAAEPPQGKGR
jgi:hypothetical protein